MATKARLYPNALHGLAGLGGPRLNALAKAAGLRLQGVHPSPGARAALLRDGLGEPGQLRRFLTAGDYDVLGERLRVGSRARLGEGFEDAVFARLFAVGEARENRPGRSGRDVSRAGEWPELAGVAVWMGLDAGRRRAVAAELAGRVGGEAMEAMGESGLVRVRDGAGSVWIAIPGGEYAMGLREEERRALGRGEHAREMAALALPVHQVEVAAFLCAEGPEGRFTGGAAVAYARRVGGRLLSEAEWEYVARAGFGVAGLDWGTWVEDGWHANYDGAPGDGGAWEPKEEPEMVRGGALLSWPWQEAGERLLLHPANRERMVAGEFPVLVARDLPGRG